MSKNKSFFEVGSLGKKEDRKRAIEIIKNGGIVAGQMFGIFGLWLDPSNLSAIKLACDTKGYKNYNRRFSTMVLTRKMLALLSHRSIPEELRELFYEKNYKKFQERLGAVGHLRLPVDSEKLKSEKVPDAIISERQGKKYIQHLDPTGHGPMHNFIRELDANGISYVGVTSLNQHAKESEITKLDRAIEFCKEKGIALLLTDPYRRGVTGKKGLVHTEGSFTIINVEDLSVIREGNVSISDISRLLGVPVSRDKNTKSAHPGFPKVDISYLDNLRLTPQQRRLAILFTHKGYSKEEILNEMKKYGAKDARFLLNCFH